MVVPARAWLAGALSVLVTLAPSVIAIPADNRPVSAFDTSAALAAEYSNPAEAKAVLDKAGIPVQPVPTTTTTTPGSPGPQTLGSLPAQPENTDLAAAIASLSGPGLLPKGSSSSKGALPQDQTNGASLLGTLQAPLVQRFISGAGTPIVAGTPWGLRDTKTNYYDLGEVPDTGVTRKYDFTVSNGTIAPDGVQVPGILINKQFPGPTIEANWGDWISVTVHNDLATEGTSLHWHGFLQKETPYYDGVPSVMQCPIAPGSTFTYRFRADLYGTSWYHSHYSAQYAGGAFGPMVVHGPNDEDYDVDLGPIMLTDWYHDDYNDLVAKTMGAPNVFAAPVASDNTLINGKNNYPCSAAAVTAGTCTLNAGLSKFKFTKGKKHRLRIINSSAEATYKFSIDNHNMTIIANDFVEVKPYDTQVVTLGVGQRTDVVIEANGKSSDAVWMRAVPVCSITSSPALPGQAIVYYETANTTAVPTTKSDVPAALLSRCSNDPLLVTEPLMPLAATTTPDVTQVVDITFGKNATGFNVWMMNNQSFRGDYNDPLLLEAKLGQTQFDPFRNVYNFGSNSSIRMVMRNMMTFGPHPIHWHGHNIQILFDGHASEWDGQTIVRPENPQRRDTQILQSARTKADGSVDPGVIVMQITADNPGVWPCHCHIAWHVSGGLYINVIERPDDIEGTQMPMVVAQTCRDWWDWSGSNIVDQIDSGL